MREFRLGAGMVPRPNEGIGEQAVEETTMESQLGIGGVDVNLIDGISLTPTGFGGLETPSRRGDGLEQGSSTWAPLLWGLGTTGIWGRAILREEAVSGLVGSLWRPL